MTVSTTLKAIYRDCDFQNVILFSYFPGAIVGSYTKIPNVDVWENKIFVVPDGVVNLVIINRDYNNIKMCKLKNN